MPDGKQPSTRLQLWVAVGLCIFGISLLGIAFFVRPPGEIHSSVLVAYGEVMTFAGALVGIDDHYHRSGDMRSSDLRQTTGPLYR